MEKGILARMDKLPAEQLPGILAPLADPKRALDDAVKAAYEPPAHEKLNMARIGLCFALSIGLLGVLFSLVINRGQLGFYSVILAVCGMVLVFVQKQYHQHNTAGGDSQRLGVYILPEGILRITADKNGKRWASFLPREEIVGFGFDEAADEYAHTVITVQTEAGDWAEYAFPSVGMLHPWHKGELERWRREGIFRWEDYKRPKNPQGE